MKQMFIVNSRIKLELKIFHENFQVSLKFKNSVNRHFMLHTSLIFSLTYSFEGSRQRCSD